MSPNFPPSRGRQLLVFVRDRNDEADRHAIECVSAVRWPGGLKPQIEDSGESGALAGWYGVRTFPAVAIVDEGMLVAIEHECSSAACERLQQVARARASELKGFGL